MSRKKNPFGNMSESEIFILKQLRVRRKQLFQFGVESEWWDKDLIKTPYCPVGLAVKGNHLSVNTHQILGYSKIFFETQEKFKNFTPEEIKRKVDSWIMQTISDNFRHKWQYQKIALYIRGGLGLGLSEDLNHDKITSNMLTDLHIYNI